jgi:1,4-dihydroxy-2-naphthoyl-CoA hydrolase
MNRTKILEIANKITKNTLMETLEIDYIDAGLDFLVATMPVSAKVHQPMGLLHGGATVALAESVGSAASHLLIDTNAFEVKGIEITANHLKSVKSGVVTATASVLHKGKTTHLWKIEIRDEDQNLISFCKLTNIVLPKSNK